MKQTIILKTYSKDTRRLYQRFAKGLLWRLYTGASATTQSFLEDRMSLTVETINRYQGIMDKHAYGNKLQDFDPGEPILKTIKITHPDQLNIVLYFEVYDRALFLLEFLWINALVSEDFHKKQQRKLHNTFTDTAAKLLALITDEKDNLNCMFKCVSR